MYLCRHSETVWNREGRLQGQNNSPLTDHGYRQAENLGRTLKRKIKRLEEFPLIASPLKRTRQTAEIVCTIIARDPSTILYEDRLMEISWGDWEGYTKPEIENRWPGVFDRRRNNKWEFQPPNGESYAELSERIASWLANVSEADNLIVITHGATGRAIRQLYGQISTSEAINLGEPQDALFLLSNGNISEVLIDS